jgi:hypothetical protein
LSTTTKVVQEIKTGAAGFPRPEATHVLFVLQIF